MFGAEAAWTSVYVKQKTPKRYFNCNTNIYMQSCCTKSTAFRICSEKYHTREFQHLDQPRYTSYQGRHRSTDPGCQEYLRRKAIIQQKAQTNKDNTIILSCHE